MGKRGAEHTKVQKEGRIRDDFTCQICGSTEETQGHHIIDYQFGGAADEDNIVTLCRVCHNEVHAGRIDLIKY